MATRKSQRIGILVIAAIMLLGTVGSFAIMILANENAKDDVAEQNRLLEEYQNQLKEKQEQAKKLSDKYYPVLLPYKDDAASFDASSIGDDVKTEDLQVGDGQELKEGTTYRAYYIGWTPDGKVFDSSFEGEALSAPIDTALINVIPGWSKGVVGMKVNGVRQITIPAKLAYGETGSGDAIPPNTPIKFIVMVIEADKTEG